MDRAKSLLHGKGIFGRQLDAWLAGSMLIGAAILAIFGSYLDAEGEPASVLLLLLTWSVFPISGFLLSLLLRALDPDRH